MWGSEAQPPAGDVVTATSTVRIVNERAVFAALRGLGAGSAAELGAATGLSKPTIAIALADLERVGLVEQTGRRTGRTGRAPRVYRLSPRAGAVLAVDVGRAWVRAALVDLTGTVVDRREQRSRRSGVALTEQVGDLADGLLRGSRMPRSRVTHTVLGSPGVHDEQADVVRLAPNLPGWGRTGLLARLRARLPGRLMIENDINLAALAELAQLTPAGSPAPDFVFLSAGTGLGLGVVLGGRLLRGAQGAAGEISYLPVGRERSAGRPNASLEELTAPGTIVTTAQRAGFAARRPEDVFDAARAGSRPAQRAVRTEARRLATAVAGVVAVLDPPLVVLGGGVGRNGDLLVAPIAEALERLVPLRVPELRVSQLGTDAPLLGAIEAGLDRARHLAFESALTAG